MQPRLCVQDLIRELILRSGKSGGNYAAPFGVIASISIGSISGPLVLQRKQSAKQAALRTAIAIRIIFKRTAQNRNGIGARLNLALLQHAEQAAWLVSSLPRKIRGAQVIRPRFPISELFRMVAAADFAVRTRPLTTGCRSKECRLQCTQRSMVKSVHIASRHPRSLRCRSSNLLTRCTGHTDVLKSL